MRHLPYHDSEKNDLDYLNHQLYLEDHLYLCTSDYENQLLYLDPPNTNDHKFLPLYLDPPTYHRNNSQATEGHPSTRRQGRHNQTDGNTGLLRNYKNLRDYRNDDLYKHPLTYQRPLYLATDPHLLQLCENQLDYHNGDDNAVRGGRPRHTQRRLHPPGYKLPLLYLNPRPLYLTLLDNHPKDRNQPYRNQPDYHSEDDDVTRLTTRWAPQGHTPRELRSQKGGHNKGTKP